MKEPTNKTTKVMNLVCINCKQARQELIGVVGSAGRSLLVRCAGCNYLSCLLLADPMNEMKLPEPPPATAKKDARRDYI